MADSSSATPPRTAPDKPKKPYAEFPLSPHASGKWQKKIRGRIHYFGQWATRVNGQLVRVPDDGWQEALEAYKAVADDLHAGREPRANRDGVSMALLCNAFLTAKTRKMEAGEIGPRMFAEYREITDLLIATFGKARLVDDLASGDFEKLRADMTERWGPVRVGNAITRVKGVFRYGFDSHLLEVLPRYGGEFSKPKKSVLRRHKATKALQLLEAGELRKMLAVADPQGKAMLLLGINCGFGNFDCATLPSSALDLDAGWVDFPRPKTGIERRCPLWPETVAAIRASVAVRHKPKTKKVAGLVFLTSRGMSHVSGGQSNAVGRVFSRIAKQAGVERPRLGYYVLRHTFRTIADASLDQPAIDLIMGHTDSSMAGHYRERIDDARLKTVTEHVRKWLFAKEGRANQ